MNLLKKFQSINVWKKSSQRAPHKPLLILLSLGKLRQGNSRLISFESVHDELKELLREFGPAKKIYHTHYPFYYLKNDGIWDFKALPNFKSGKGYSPNKGDLISANAKGGFTEEIFNEFLEKPELVKQVAQILLSEHFPETYHEDILQAVGLDICEENGEENVKRKKRDPNFRNKIMVAYGYKCAICGFDLRIGQTSICLEAAHIKWHQAGGPAIEQNGLALCTMHHKLFDRGAFSINPEKKIMVAENVNGSTGLDEWLMKYHWQSIKKPVNDIYLPKPDYTDWHVKEVFKAPYRP